MIRADGRDPRPDLAVDSRLWVLVLEAALQYPLPYNELYWPLQGMRCCGASIAITEKGTFKLGRFPEYEEEEFKRHCEQYLRPHLGHLRLILNQAMEAYYARRRS